MADVRVVGLDIAKSIFQVHGIDAAGATVLQKRLTRARLLPFFERLPPCLIGIEACATSHRSSSSYRSLRSAKPRDVLERGRR